MYVCIQEQAVAKAAPVASSPANVLVRLIFSQSSEKISSTEKISSFQLYNVVCIFLVIYVHTYISTCMMASILDTQSSSQLCAVFSFLVAGEDHYFSSRSGSCSSSADGLQGRSWGVCMAFPYSIIAATIHTYIHADTLLIINTLANNCVWSNYYLCIFVCK